MKLQHRHIIGIGLLYVFLLGFASCANESFDLPCGEAEENSRGGSLHPCKRNAR